VRWLAYGHRIRNNTPHFPARGKTHISRSLERYLRWLGVKTRCYSLGDYRRKVLGAAEKIPADYFEPGEKSEETTALRQRIKDGIENQVWDFFSTQGGQVVIYDANNSDKKSRKALLEKFEARGVHVIFLGGSRSFVFARRVKLIIIRPLQNHAATE
jgi:6-phosphofructo-2-kinase/fructose-2,6-biphosphatase 4